MKKMVLVVALATLVAFASVVMAQTKSPEPALKWEGNRFSGVIEKVDQNAKTITVRGKVGGQEKVMTFAIDNKTKITGDAKTGTRCAVDYFIPRESGKPKYKPVALRVDVAPVDYATPKLAPVK